MSSPPEEETSTFRPFTKAERIQQLNEIDKSILQLVQTAGQTLKILTASKEPGEAQSSQEKRQAFENASNAYLKTLQSVDVRLRRQILGLEEADIIPAEKVKSKNKGKPAAEPVERRPAVPGNMAGNKADDTITEGGLGNLDIGFLNSRSGRVGRDMEAELWAKSRRFLEDLDNGNYNSQPLSQRKDEIKQSDG
ncbi:d44b1866-8019-4497-b108-059e40ed5e2f [Sclerotinia trifoliorum]|uniref:Mediator of RNA polymerase II transcription subunit 11 n=1 Tax=Sclerotinia trifoliorum TaxID=28548 RepID=A0A8H2ZMS6_9HELO|nr:d44b1866-8019-4497-b108-059e40ed5e2f [Sclerotinia trifoliorum]